MAGVAPAEFICSSYVYVVNVDTIDGKRSAALRPAEAPCADPRRRGTTPAAGGVGGVGGGGGGGAAKVVPRHPFKGGSAQGAYVFGYVGMYI